MAAVGEDRQVDIVEVEEALRNADAEIQVDLPKHNRCSAHTLNLMATTDISEVIFFTFLTEKINLNTVCPQQLYAYIMCHNVIEN